MQNGGKDCGAFVIATAIASGLNPSRQNFKQEATLLIVLTKKF